MKQEILFDNADSFLNRFNHFHDAIIRSIRIDYKRDSIKPSITIVVEAKDWEAQPESWINVIFEVQDVTTYTLTQSERYAYARILSSHIGFFNQKIYLDLASGGIDSSPALDHFEESPFLIVGERCYWQMSPIAR